MLKKIYTFILLIERNVAIVFFISIIIIIIITFPFIAFTQAVPNAKIFLLGELQLVVKGQGDVFTLHV